MKKIVLSLIMNFIVGLILGALITSVVIINTIKISGINGDTGLVQVECLGQEINYYYE